MNFKDWWNSLYFPEINKKPSSLSKDIINYRDVIPIPKRRDYITNPLAIKEIDKYKEKYYNLLSTDSVLVSKQLDISAIREKLEINAKILYQACIKDEDDTKLLKEESTSAIEMYVEKAVEIAKLEIYRDTINSLYEDTKFKLIALTEVYKEHKIKFKKHKLAIQNEINNLTHLLSIFLTQAAVALLKSSTYITELQTEITKNQIMSDERNEIITKKLQATIELASNVIPDKVNEIINLQASSLTKIAYLEREMEIYVYTHKDDIQRVDDYIKSISDEPITNENVESTLKLITKFELLYKMFDKYGRNLVTNEQVKRLYSLKFKAKTMNIMTSTTSPFTTSISKENQIYQEIVMDKINIINRGLNQNISELFKEDASNAIKCISKIIKTNTGIFAAFEILQDTRLLKLLLCFDYKNGLEDYFTKVVFFRLPSYIPDRFQGYYLKHPNNNDFYDKIFTWEDYLPLDTFFRLDKKEPFELTQNPLKRLYNLYKKHNRKDKYSLPNGLTSIITKPRELYDQTPIKKEIDDYFGNIKDKILVPLILPESLEIIAGQAFPNGKIATLNLNEGYTVLGDYSFSNQPIEELVISSTVRSIGPYSLWWECLKDIYFKNYEESLTLHDRNILKMILSKTIFSWDEYHSIKEPKKYSFITTLKSFWLLSIDGNTSVEIKISDLPKITNKENSILIQQATGAFMGARSLENDELDEIIDYVAKAIDLQTGHILFPSKQKVRK